MAPRFFRFFFRQKRSSRRFGLPMDLGLVCWRRRDASRVFVEGVRTAVRRTIYNLISLIESATNRLRVSVRCLHSLLTTGPLTPPMQMEYAQWMSGISSFKGNENYSLHHLIDIATIFYSVFDISVHSSIFSDI